MADPVIDEEFRALIPPPQPEELRQLESSLLQEGNRDPVVVWKETHALLDGHQRYELCHKHHIQIKPPLEMSFPGRNEAKIWIIRNQFGRRNLSPYQRSVLALNLQEILEKQAKAKEQLRKTVQQTKPSPIPGEYLDKYVDILTDIDRKEHPEGTEEEHLSNAIDRIISYSGPPPRQHPAIPEFVYFIQTGDKVKIGCSGAPEFRLQNVTKHIPEAKLLGYCKGGQPLEKELHRLFKPYLIHNEWYKLNDYTVSTIKAFVPEADFFNIEKINSWKESAKYFDISEGTISKVRVIEAKATQEEKEKLKRGDTTVNQVFIRIHRDEVREKVKQTDWPTGKYRVIYADPPWKYSNSMPVDIATQQEDHYPTMPISEICLLPVKDLALEDAILFLWVTSPVLEEAFKVINAWGFKYKASFVWDKVEHNMGHYNSVRHEFLLVAVSGSCQPDTARLYDSVQSIPRAGHSRKPGFFREMIETLYPYGPKLELFGREQVAGWEVYGNQLPGLPG